MKISLESSNSIDILSSTSPKATGSSYICSIPRTKEPVLKPAGISTKSSVMILVNFPRLTVKPVGSSLFLQVAIDLIALALSVP